MNISYKNATEAFEDLYAFIMGQGIDTNVGTKAVYNVGFYLRNPEQRVITTEWRKFNKRYAEREYAWYMSGNRSVAEIKKAMNDVNSRILGDICLKNIMANAKFAVGER